MNIAVAVKVVPDDQDIQITPAGELDTSKARQVISTYDLNAIEAAALMAAANGGSRVYAVTVGPAAIDESKLKKDILARGVDELFMAADDAYADLDAHATAEVLALEIEKAGGCDIVFCGDGSADNYAQQVGIQLGFKLGIPCVSGIMGIELSGPSIIATRKLDDVVETIEAPLPCVVSVMPDIALPRVLGMRDILAAGKKPMYVNDGGDAPAPSTETVAIKAPEAAERKLDVRDASDNGAIEAFAAAIKAALE